MKEGLPMDLRVEAWALEVNLTGLDDGQGDIHR
jgi:hypothetical protein